MKRRNGTLQLRVDPIMCDGYGHCAELAPELVTMDEWGYPMLLDRALTSATTNLLHSARLAIKRCPRQALWLEPVVP